MGTADATRFRKWFSPFKTLQEGRKIKLFPLRADRKRIFSFGENLRKTQRWLVWQETPDRENTVRGVPMLRFADDHPTASLWLLAAVQGAVMLGFNVALRVLLS